MILIPVFSDTHGFKLGIKKCSKIAKKYDFFFHLGDNIKDALDIEDMSGKRGYKVLGNTDIGYGGEESITLNIEGYKIFISHGHKFGVKSSLDKISYFCEENKVDLAVFGHTHIPTKVTINNVVYFNPGSVSLPREGNQGSYGIIKIKDNRIATEIVEI